MCVSEQTECGGNGNNGSVGSGGGLGARRGSVQQAMATAQLALGRAERTLMAGRPAVAELYPAVAGVHELSMAMAALVQTLIRTTDVTLAGHADEQLRSDLVADLRAMHGCLTTAALLIAPSLDDLGPLVISATAERLTSEDPS